VSGEIDVGTVTLTTNEAGFIGYQIDQYGDEQGVEAGTVVQPFGFLSRPLDPSDEGSCEALYFYRGNELFVLPGQDRRAIALVPILKKGASVQHNALGGFAHFENDGTNSTWTCYVPVEFNAAGTPTKTCLVQVGKSAAGKVMILLQHPNGQRLEVSEDDGNAVKITNSLGTAWLQVDDSGVSINGNVKISGNVGSGTLAYAWMTAVAAALSTLGAPVGPAPISLTA
jgi:hypothetical protein